MHIFPAGCTGFWYGDGILQVDVLFTECNQICWAEAFNNKKGLHYNTALLK